MSGNKTLTTEDECPEMTDMITMSATMSASNCDIGLLLSSAVTARTVVIIKHTSSTAPAVDNTDVYFDTYTGDI